MSNFLKNLQVAVEANEEIIEIISPDWIEDCYFVFLSDEEGKEEAKSFYRNELITFLRKGGYVKPDPSVLEAFEDAKNGGVEATKDNNLDSLLFLELQYGLEGTIKSLKAIKSLLKERYSESNEIARIINFTHEMLKSLDESPITANEEETDKGDVLNTER